MTKLRKIVLSLLVWFVAAVLVAMGRELLFGQQPPGAPPALVVLIIAAPFLWWIWRRNDKGGPR